MQCLFRESKLFQGQIWGVPPLNGKIVSIYSIQINFVNYILNSFRYLKSDEDGVREDMGEVSEESDKEQEIYKHRYEEPDQEFVCDHD